MVASEIPEVVGNRREGMSQAVGRDAGQPAVPDDPLPRLWEAPVRPFGQPHGGKT